MTQSVIAEADGSALLPLPPEVLEKIGLRTGDTVSITVEGDRIVLRKAEDQQHRSLDEMLAEYEAAGVELSDEDRETLGITKSAKPAKSAKKKKG
ncbi:AbrB/MazE/SpoVT family DNA-binding domain-containing protein [Sutterella sp.]|uniref:AbrB/MazE/SpoVT family DNA-binding domain-containing protein n=1 Tax=Sutterella sp. TaxID=1981025 RepID=UPI0026DFE73C|nr:AbrB/MazE/SpoVT family DNA-binding domain-containing protein [Sutterella sp.]MDO5532457.1 AbrB/MazE/SpoVT family DNA-binding domain-containing protein [Sutterella sp.]